MVKNTISNILQVIFFTNSKLDNSSITIGDDTSTNFSVDLGGSLKSLVVQVSILQSQIIE